MKNSNEMMESLLQRRDRYIAIKERKNRTIRRVVVPICSICLVALIGVGFWKGPEVEAGIRRMHQRYDNAKFWEYNANVDSEKNIEKDKVALDKESLGEESKKGTQELTYEITNKTLGGSKLDVYVDPDQNQYTYDENGNLKSYKQNRSKRKDLPDGQKPCTEEESIELARAYLGKLFGNRVEGFVFDYTHQFGAYSGIDVYFARKYGVDNFITGQIALATIQENGDLSSAVISKHSMEGFNAKSVENLTKEKVAEWAFAKAEAMDGYVSGSATIGESFYLQQSETGKGFSIRTSLAYTIIDEATGQEQKIDETVYYEID